MSTSWTRNKWFSRLVGTLYVRRDSLAVNLKPSSPRTLSWAGDKFSCLRFFSFVSPQNYALFRSFIFAFRCFSLASCLFYRHGYCSSTSLVVIIVPITFNTIQFAVAIIIHRCVSKSYFFTDRVTFSWSLRSLREHRSSSVEEDQRKRKQARA